jgi:predicted nucleic acid-binding Zn ribbon protein
MKKSNEQSLGEVIKNLIDELRWNDKINGSKIIASWEKIMGANIAAYTDHIEIHKKTLIVHLKSSALRAELNYAKSKIIKNINLEMGSEVINDIVFR